MLKMLCRSVMTYLLLLLLALPVAAQAEQKPIIILHTNDIHCGVAENLGIDRVAQYKKQLLETTPYVALVDAGDAIQGEPIGRLSRGSSIIKLMNAAGYDFAVPGNHEFDYGMPQFLKLASQLHCGYYSCNLLAAESLQPVLKPYKMLHFGAKTVAFIGITTPETLSSSTPVFFQNKDGKYIYSFCEDVGGEKLYKRVQTTINEVKAAGADYVIAVAHLGLHTYYPKWSSESLIRNTRGLTAVLDGHTHEIADCVVTALDGRAVRVLQTGTKLQALGKLTIAPDGTIATELLTDLPAGDIKIQQVLQREQQHFTVKLKKPLGKSEVTLYVADPLSGTRLIRNSETNMGDFLADAYKTVLACDAVMLNGGGMRAQLKSGEISYEDVFKVFPFGNQSVVISVTGRQLLEALEMAARKTPAESGAFAQVAGISYVINTGIPSGVVIDERGSFVKYVGPHRISDVRVNGEPLVMIKQYSIGGNDYSLLKGGDGMTMFKDAPLLKASVFNDAELVCVFIREHLGGVIDQRYAKLNGGGRIIIR